MYVITTENYNLKSIRVQKPYKLNNKLHFEINYTAVYNTRVPLIIQSPTCIMPFNYSLYDDKYLQLHLQITNDDFAKMINDIKTTIYNKVKKYHEFTSMTCSYLRLYNNDYERVGVFDSNAKTSSLTNLVKLDKLYVLFQVEKLVIDQDNAAVIMFKLLQVKKNAIDTKSQCMIGKPPPPPPGPPPPPPPIFKPPIFKAASIAIKTKQSFKPPSLKEILDAKSKLKNIVK
jgi:hypothetical protein